MRKQSILPALLSVFLLPALARAQDQAPAADTTSLANVILPRDLSPIGMFLHADHVVQAIMIGLLLASLATWTVGLVKLVELHRAKARARKILRALALVSSLAEADKSLPAGKDPVSRLLQTAQAEIQLSSFGDMEALKERVSWLLERLEAAAFRRVGNGMGILASVGAIAPFVGLLGTVWGIMNSFIGISNAHTTNLAVVAPGIAEALLATALGLFAAIPAVVLYNALARSITGYRALVADAGVLVMRLVSLEGEYARRRMSPAAE